MLPASNNTTMKFSFIQPAHIHEQGTRSNQEDSIFPQAGTASSEDRLYIVCDGMGGHEHGEVASSTVCEALSDYLFQNTTSDEPLTDKLLTGALTYAYERLTEALGDKSSASPGTTLAMLYFHRGGCAAVHIGDSRIYHIRPSERRIMYKSRDHSLVYDLYLSGNLEYAAMKQHPRKNVITRVMMPAPNQRCRADVAHITDVAMGDVFMLCSDGLLENIDDAEIVDVLSSGQTAATMAESLKAMTSENKDNRSAYLIQVEGVMREMRDQNLRDTEAEMLQRSICRIESGTTVVLTDESVQDTVQQPAQPQYQSATVSTACRRGTPTPQGVVGTDAHHHSISRHTLSRILHLPWQQQYQDRGARGSICRHSKEREEGRARHVQYNERQQANDRQRKATTLGSG